MATLLTPENFRKGFLIDDDLMAGVTEDPEAIPGEAMGYVAFLINHMTGEYLACESFRDLEQALATVNRLERDWVYEAAGGCGGGKCGEGNCKGGNCGLARKEDGDDAASCSTGSCET